ncbi:hypothetical protein BT96DRAFT_943217 [Gymnopus androsaceus JB14]|uniref:Uncharacterized protein n=1 Tax=Gymnopus androsaceus JB14 TaxID=1447944 RepID=A0A6A4H9A9_9AGAR|nr:hypothetical protein BT96DRAFT_943217 [Gymnopus androsaceus JB14]
MAGARLGPGSGSGPGSMHIEKSQCLSRKNITQITSLGCMQLGTGSILVDQNMTHHESQNCNEVKVEAAKQKAKDWLDGNKKTKTIIARAVPLSKLYLIQNATSAHNAWLALKQEYEPANTLTAININQQIIRNACPAGGDPVSWLQSMTSSLQNT